MQIETDLDSRTTGRASRADLTSLALAYRRVRAMSEQIAVPLSAEDCSIQTMPDVSPTKWHLAHTTWFFETFLLKQRADFQPFDKRYESLFNSYYNSVGNAFPRDKRGLISRPGLDDVLSYRRHADQHVLDWLAAGDLTDQQCAVLVLGLNHEQQHQELMFTDIKHVLFCNPEFPAYQPSPLSGDAREATPMTWKSANEAIVEIGYDARKAGFAVSPAEFAYDNEGPRHRALIHPHQIASRCVTNGEYREFIQDGGYQNPMLWLSLGWNAVRLGGWETPMYWLPSDDGFVQYSLAGCLPLRMNDPVCHVSFFEADAFARWAGKRLPTEFEWESAARSAVPGDAFANHLLAANDPIHPQYRAIGDLLGNVWEWTASQYQGYPGYSPAAGALGEYNGKFMCNQFVLRGGSCATSSDHIRATYRNFFPPDTRWQFSGIRLAAH